MITLDWPGRQEALAAVQSYTFPNEFSAVFSFYDGDPHKKQSHIFDCRHHAARLICADNLPFLAEMASHESERFHFIYIDPPYNTGQKFAYLDRQAEHSSAAWLSMMYPRLFFARQVLFEDGLICISIDEREYSHLIVILREIFGVENHITTIKWKKKRKPSFLSRQVSCVFEYIVLFAKDFKKLPKLCGEKASETSRPVLNQGNPETIRVIPQGAPARCIDGQKSPGRLKNRTLDFELLDSLIVKDHFVQQDCRVRGPFRVSQEILNETVFVTKNWGLRRLVKPEELGLKHITDDGSQWPTNEDADSEMLSHFGARLFPFSKPSEMLLKLIQMYPSNGEPQYFLDFFAGSGSFGEAVLRANKIDCNIRKVTLVQSAEDFRHEAAPELKTIFDLMCKRIELAWLMHQI